MKRLVNMLLGELIVILGVVLYVLVGGIADGVYWWHETVMTRAELHVCTTKHDLLLRAIKKEALWTRLGMDQAPWLR